MMAGSAVDVGKQVKDLTIEFWFKPTHSGGSSAKRNLLMIMKNGDPFIKVMKDTSGDLRCYPFNSEYGQITDYAVEYFDY